MGDRADPATAPPGGLLVGGDADRSSDDATRDMCGVAVPRLHAVVIMPRRHEDDRLAVGCLEYPHDVRRDERATRKDAEIRRLEVSEQGVIALDRHHRLPGRGTV